MVNKSKSSAAVFIFKVNLPNSSSKAQLVLSFADRDEIFNAVEIGNDWHLVSIVVPNEKTRSGFTYFARKKIITSSSRQNGEITVTTIENEIVPSSMRTSTDEMSQVYAWEFGQQKSCHEVPIQSDNVVVNLCKNAPKSGSVVVDRNDETLCAEKDLVSEGLKLEKGTYLNVMCPDDVDSTDYLWVKAKCSKKGHQKLTPEFRKHLRHVPSMEGNSNIMFRTDVWGKAPTAYKCTKHMRLSDDFLMYAYSIRNIYERSHEVYNAACDLIIMGDQCTIDEEPEPVEEYNDQICDITVDTPVQYKAPCDINTVDNVMEIKHDSTGDDTPAKRTPFLKIVANKVTSSRRSILKFFRREKV